MADFGPFVTSGVLAGIGAFLASRGVKYGDVLSAAGLTPEDVDPADHKEVPLDQVIARYLGDADLILTDDLDAAQIMREIRLLDIASIQVAERNGGEQSRQ